MIKIDTINSLLLSEKVDCNFLNQWEREFSQERKSELFLHGRSKVKVRVIGPVIKARKIFVNDLSDLISKGDFKNLLSKGEVPNTYIEQNRFKEIEEISNKNNWSKCMLANVLLLSDSDSYQKNNIYPFSFSKGMVEKMIQRVTVFKDACFSGIFANDISISRANNRGGKFADYFLEVSPKKTLLSKEHVSSVLRSGIIDLKNFYRENNRKNLDKMAGFFYSFEDMDKTSKIDPYMKPFEDYERISEENQQYDYIISKDMAIENGWEEISILNNAVIR